MTDTDVMILTFDLLTPK